MRPFVTGGRRQRHREHLPIFPTAALDLAARAYELRADVTLYDAAYLGVAELLGGGGHAARLAGDRIG